MRILFYTIFIFLLFIGCKSTKISSPNFSPKYGTIIFEKQKIITNETLLKTSLDSFTEEVTKTIKRQYLTEKKEYNEPVDTLKLNQLLALSKIYFKQYFMDNNKTLKIHKFQDSIIIAYEKNNNKIIGDYTLIYRNSKTYSKLAKIDSSTMYRKKKMYPYKKPKSILVTENKRDKKRISGFECFKLIVEVNEDNSDIDDEISTIFKDEKTIYELYVTDKIQCDFHPVFLYKDILKKYYPLEIKEYSNLLNGVETNFKLLELSLK